MSTPRLGHFLGAAANTVIHSAGPIVAGVQRCSRCGCNLPPGPDEAWLVGCGVEVLFGGCEAWGSLDEPSCERAQ